MDRTMDSYRNPVNTLELAGRKVDTALQNDSSAPNLILMTGANQQTATASGLVDHDYPSLSGLALGLADFTQIKTLNKVPLPPEVMEHFGHMQCHCMMGLFTEINRAWLTIDSDIYVWTYEHGSDVAYFDGLNDTIVSVGLVLPKPGVFHNFIKYLLVITTTVDIVVLGVTFSSNSDGPLGELEEMHLVPDPVFVVPTDGVAITTITGTNDGRLFLGGRDGSLFEISYQAESGWFGKRCKKINHSTGALSFLMPSFLNVAFSEEDPIAKIAIDNSRHILYTLTEKGSIEVYDLGEKGNSIHRVAKVGQNSLVQQAMNVVKTLDSGNFRPIISISAIEARDSAQIHLVAITQTGVRLYLTTVNLNNFTANQRPYTLHLVHVRLPPGFSANIATVRPKNVHMADYREGSVVLISSPGPDYDQLWCLSADPFPFSHSLMEAYTTIFLDGPCWAMAEVRHDNYSKPSDTIPPLVVRQHMEPPRKYVVLTAQGAHIFHKLRPVDMLRQLLIDSHGPESDAVKAYFQVQKEDQACATSLILACSQLTQNAEIAEMATRAFLMYGGEPRIVQNIPPQMRGTRLYDTSFEFLKRPMVDVYPFENPSQNPYDGFAPIKTSTPPQAGKSVTFSDQNYVRNKKENNQDFLNVGFCECSPEPTIPYNSSTLGGYSFTAPNPVPKPASFNPQLISTPGPAFSNLTFQQNMSAQQSMIASPNTSFDIGSQMSFSAKHNGLYLYIGRILRPIWNVNCVQKVLTEARKEYLTSHVNNEQIDVILGHLLALKAFLLKNTNITVQNLNQNYTRQVDTTFDNPNVTMINQSNRTVRMAPNIQDMQIEERQSLDALKTFVVQCCEILGLWKILCEHQIHLLINTLTKDQQNALINTSFKDLFLFGHDICSALIISLINSYLGDNASVDSISAKLRDVCPNLYRSEDAACSKANEILLSAKTQQNREEREAMLQSALQLCKDIAPNMNISAACQKFIGSQYYNAVIDLCVTCAKKMDPENIAEHYYKNNEPAEDQDGYQLYARRMDVYKEVVNMLDQLYSQNFLAYTSDIPATPGPPPRPQEGSFFSPQTDTTQLTRYLINEILHTNDELLHIAIYEWMLNKQMHSDLLNITNRSLENYFIKGTQHDPQAVQVYDLLWKYYEKNENHASAAQILNTLATKTGTCLNLKQRLEYLARAVMCMRSDRIGYAPHYGVFLRELEDKIEVARVQEQILNSIISIRSSHERAQEAVRNLNSNLFDITQLYEDFAEPFALWECKLAIIHCSGHCDTELIQNIWYNIIISNLKSASGSVDDKLIILLNKIKLLWNDYKDSDMCFPLPFILNFLEEQSCKMRASYNIVPDALVSMGVPLGNLITIYQKMSLVYDTQWKIPNDADEYHLYKSLAEIINSFLLTADNINNAERRKLIAQSQDVIAGVLSTLYSKPNTEELICILRNLQAKLSRL